MSLSNANKIRHASAVRNMLKSANTSVFKETSKTPSTNKSALLPKVRIGSSVTAEGAAFVLDDESKVAKILFFDTESQRLQYLKEYEIGKELGDAGVGPKVYTYYYILVGAQDKIPNNMMTKQATRSAMYIIMENLAHNAKKLMSLWDYVRTHPYPARQVETLLQKLESKKILHGDLHSGNIMVKIRSDGTKRLYFIDFGRSMRITNAQRVNNSYFRQRGYVPTPGYPGYYTPMNGDPVGINRLILQRNFKFSRATIGSPKSFKNTPPPPPKKEKTPSPKKPTLTRRLLTKIIETAREKMSRRQPRRTNISPSPPARSQR